MTRSRLIAYHVLQLSDRKPSVRLDSIQQLVLLEAIEALDALRQVVEHDDDLEIRRAAQQAGRQLYFLSIQQS